MNDNGKDDQDPAFTFPASEPQRASLSSDQSSSPDVTTRIDHGNDLDTEASQLRLTTRRFSLSASTSIFGLSASTAAVDPKSSPKSGLCITDQEWTRKSEISGGSRPSNNSGMNGFEGSRGVDFVRATATARMLPRVEKDVDDPTTPPPLTRPAKARQESTLGTSLSRLLAVQAAAPPETSRSSSYTHQARQTPNNTRSTITAEAASLPDHIYTRGFLEGRHSDITVHAFGQGYKLHRLILDRSPFFRSALSGPWLESNARETTLHPEDIDSSITQVSFELALKRLYGLRNPQEEESEAVGLFATGCWLEMQDLVDTAIECILRQMSSETLAPLIKIMMSNYYGRAGDKVMASAKSMLCRDGWHMPLSYWDDIPGEVVREVVGGDGLFIDGEWDRWLLAKRLLDRRLKMHAREASLVELGGSGKLLKAPDSYILMAIRFDPVYRRTEGRDGGRDIPPDLQPWVSVYTHADVEPMFSLLDGGVHYIHLDFEQLQTIRSTKDALGLPVMPDKVVSNALWQQMELRQKIMNVPESLLELGISVSCPGDARKARIESNEDAAASMLSATSLSQSKQSAQHSLENTNADTGSEALNSSSEARRYWIPSLDRNIVMGGNAEPVVAISNESALQQQLGRSSIASQPDDVQWTSPPTTATTQSRPGSEPADTEAVVDEDDSPAEAKYTKFPPFRFAAEFPNPRLLKKKQRVYSRTVFYAGSLWNIYLQKVASSRSKQLGVYLHRVKEEETEEVIAGTLGMAQGSVDERIGQLERDMIMNAERTGHHRTPRQQTSSSTGGGDAADADSSLDTHLTSGPSRSSTSRSTASYTNSLRTNPSVASRSSQFTALSSASSGDGLYTPGTDSDSEETDSDSHRQTAASGADNSRPSHVPTLPPYVDVRPTIKTYFKIYSPSRGGRMLSVYESAPDKFNFSQSWGWKSSTLMLDEGFLGEVEGAGGSGVGGQGDESADGSVGLGAGVGGNGASDGHRGWRGESDGKLRFMVVIGNV